VEPAALNTDTPPVHIFLTFLPIVHQIQDASVEIKPLTNIDNARISAESVKEVNEITTRLGNDIIKKD
jgi:hypothetical protein